MLGQLNFIPAVGDWIKVYLPQLGVWHHGVVVSFSWNGPVVAHNRKGAGTITSYWNDFSEGQTVHLHKRAQSGAHVREILVRVNANLNKSYRLFAQNCEHFASFVFTGKAESTTVQGWTLVAACVALFALLFSE
jgi:lecithin:retinol acyltransferase